jgi:hypothetical protein
MKMKPIIWTVCISSIESFRFSVWAEFYTKPPALSFFLYLANVQSAHKCYE